MLAKRCKAALVALRLDALPAGLADHNDTKITPLYEPAQLAFARLFGTCTSNRLVLRSWPLIRSPLDTSSSMASPAQQQLWRDSFAATSQFRAFGI